MKNARGAPRHGRSGHGQQEGPVSASVVAPTSHWARTSGRI